MIESSMRHEILRKLVHVSSLWMAVFVFYAEKAASVTLFGLLAAALLLVEIGRFRIRVLSDFFVRVFGPILRPFEMGANFSPTGSFYFVLSVFICVLFFERIDVVAAICVLVIADTAAALVGRSIGKIRLGRKTFEGFMAFVLCSCAILLWFYRAPFSICFSIAFFIACVELLSGHIRLDDNLTIPLATALLCHFFL